MNPVKVLEISGIAEVTARRVQVIVKETGKCLWLPRKVIDFKPGGVILPVWLWKKIMAGDPPTELNMECEARG